MDAAQNGSSASLEPPPVKRAKVNNYDGLVHMPKGEETLKNRKSYVAPSQVLHYRDCPLKIVRGKGQYFWDEHNQRYLDTVNNVSHVGHCHEKVVEACSSQMSILNTNSRFLNDKMVTYAKRLCAKLPGNLSCCFFANSGSEANDLALQIAQVVAGDEHIISIEGAYHGHLMSLKPLSTYKLSKGKQESANISVIPIPDEYRGKYTDPDTAGQLYADEFKQILGGKKVGAFIHETILGCAGQVVLPKEYLKAVYKHVRDAGGLCIADEVQTGFGRIGTHFWSFESQGVCPDIVTLGKPIGNGHPVSAVVTTKEIAEKFAARGIEYFNTFGGNPVSMAIAEAVLSVIEEEGLQAHAKEMGDYLKDELATLKEKHQCIGNIRGSGLYIGVDFVKDRETKEADSELAHNVEKLMLIDHQIIVLVDGIHSNVIKIKPPMVITKDDCSSIIKALDAVLKKLNED